MNFLETWRQWRRHRGPGYRLYLTTLDAYPLEVEIVIRAILAGQKKAHVRYLDGFSPRCNPDMWSAELMAEVFAHIHDSGTLLHIAKGS